MIKRSALGLALALSLPVLAQDDANGDETQDKRATQLEEIVVTAQKKKQLLQETPISMAAFGAPALEKMGVSDLEDITAQVPNVDITPFPNSRSSLIIFMRGVGNNDSQTTQDPAVGVYLDGVYLGRTVGLTTDVADLDRVEVLRGPQGTLYGRNTTGGAINLLTAKPQGEFGLKQVLGLGTRGHMNLKTQVETPLWNGLAAKLSLVGDANDGWVNNINAGPDFGELDKRGGRLALLWNPSPGLSVDYAFDTSRSTGPQQFYQVLRINEDNANTSMATQTALENERDAILAGGGTPPDQLAMSLAGIVIVNETLIPEFRARASESRLDNGEWDVPVRDSITDVSGHHLIASWNTPLGEFKSTSAYRDLFEFVIMDYGSGVQWFDVEIDIEHQQLSQEFQLVGEYNQAWDYVAGLYYYTEEGREHEIDRIAGDVAEDRTIWSDNNAWAAYGQLSWSPHSLTALEISLGGRYTVDQRKARKYSINFTDSPDNTQSGEGKWSNFTPSLSVSYDWDGGFSTYGKVVTGYKSGGFNVRSTEDNFLPPYDEENMISYELGYKSTWWDNRLQLNLAAFYSEYTDMQIQQILDNSKIYLTDVFNAGESEIKGFELDLVAVPLPGLTTSLAYGFTDAQFTEVIDNNPNSQTYQEDISAIYTMPYAPEHTWTVNLDYEFPPLAGLQLQGWLGYRWRDVRFGTASNPDMEGFKLDRYGLLDTRLSLSGMRLFGLDTSLALWGRNVTDEEYLVHDISMSFFHSGYFGEPRTVGLDLSLAW